ncbi:hypothetical protein G173_gp099 [Erwinia phage phiEaH2]|uniref:Uncharacterized protein n=1 Tax=Erwinia phage phiEaH2 TaxID=1029988 RepID=J7KE07_9CAUD|nr:hypothetical protein G173_gp099 [Erwinia phage phiEaH2]AFQ96644.1 hypothetical protein [Erwinia phage phiEaH2]
MRVVEIRKDVWMESIAESGGWEGIEADLPETNDAPLVLLVQAKGERLIRGIFHRVNLVNPLLRATAVGLSEIDPDWFKDYIKRKSPNNVINIELCDETRMARLQPTALCIYDPNLEQDTPSDINLKLGTILESNIVRLVTDTLEHLQPPMLIIRNPNGLALDHLMNYLEHNTTYLVNSRTYTLKGE